jgi:hypothetical protein
VAKKILYRKIFRNLKLHQVSRYAVVRRWTCGPWGSPTVSWASRAIPVLWRASASITRRNQCARAARRAPSRSGTWKLRALSAHTQVRAYSSSRRDTVHRQPGGHPQDLGPGSCAPCPHTHRWGI